jgi:ABC-type sugar transport system substrate-binding protein
LAADLARSHVNAIVALGSTPAVAKAATVTIPVVFFVGPIRCVSALSPASPARVATSQAPRR